MAILLLTFSVMSFSVLDTIAKYLMQHYPVAQVVWARYTGHIVLLGVLAWPIVGLDLLRTRQPRIQIARATVQFVATVCNFWALSYLSLADVRGIIFFAPVLVTVCAVYWLRERASTTTWIALFAGFAGVMMIIRPGAGVFTWASLLAVGAAICVSAYQLLTRCLGGDENPLISLFYTAVVGAVLASLFMPYVWVQPSLAHALLMLAVGALGGAGHFAMIKAFQLERVSALMPISYTQLLWTGLLGFLVFRELPDFWSTVGLTVIVCSGLYVAFLKR